MWFFLAGPAHLSGMVWSTNVPGNLGNSVGNLWSHLGQWGPISSQALAQEAPALGGYRGPAAPSASYLGVGLLVVVAVGTLVVAIGSPAVVLRRPRRDHRRPQPAGRWGPVGSRGRSSTTSPSFDNVVQSRFAAVFGLCAAVMVAIIVDRSRSAATGVAHRPRPPTRRCSAMDAEVGGHRRAPARLAVGGGPGGPGPGGCRARLPTSRSPCSR